MVRLQKLDMDVFFFIPKLAISSTHIENKRCEAARVGAIFLNVNFQESRLNLDFVSVW